MKKILWWLVDEKKAAEGKKEGVRKKMLKGEKIAYLTGQNWLKNAPSWVENSLFKKNVLKRGRMGVEKTDMHNIYTQQTCKLIP